MSLHRRKIGLVLGSGGARGWSHIGVVEELADAGIPFHCVVGCSMGALVGAVFAAGKLELLKASAQRLDWKEALYRFLEVGLPRSGLVDGKKVVDFVRSHTRASRIEDLRLPFATVATDVMTGKEVAIDRGDLMEAVRASISVPGIFTPVERAGQILVDGGLVNPVPVSVARAMGADYVIAVDVNHGKLGVRREGKGPASKPAKRPRLLRHPALDKLDEAMRRFDAEVLKPAYERLTGAGAPTLFDVLGNSLLILEAQVTESRLKIDPPDVLVRPAVGQMNFMEFHRAAEAIEAGRRAAREVLPDIRAARAKPWDKVMGLAESPFSNAWKKRS